MPFPEGKYSGRVFSRDNGGGGGLSTDTIIIIAVVAGCVVVLALSLFMWRALKRCCSRSKSAPLPPVQGLAHHRRAVLAEHYSVSSRPATWLDPSAESLPPLPRQRSFQTNSAASLLPSEKNPSLYTDDLGTAESSHSSPVNLGDPVKLYPPNRIFYGPSDSVDSSPAASQHSLPSASPSPVPFSEESSSISHGTDSPVSHGRSQSSLSRPHSTRSRSQVRLARRLSQISSGTAHTTHTTHTRRSTSTVRGAPHLTNMQIVLPAPLGPQPIYPGQSATSQIYRQSSATGSGFADQWITNSNNSENGHAPIAPVPDLPPEVRRKLSKRSGSRSRSVQPAPSSYAPPTRASSRQPNPRHTRSTSSLRHEVARTRGEHEHTPYANLADLAESAYEGEPVRGRSRTSSRVSTLSFDPQPPPPLPTH